jgi:cytochrome c oxidase cbb3-type subunit 3
MASPARHVSIKRTTGMAVALLAAWSSVSLAQSPPPEQPAGALRRSPDTPLPTHTVPASSAFAGGTTAAKLLSVPVTALSPGAVPLRPEVNNPVAGNAEALQRGMSYFIAFNCVGCHAPNGGGGMGPSLSNTAFIYGGEPANIYLSIYQGRPNGMPAWGTMLPDSIIWDLVTYIQSISSAPSRGWGQTFSRETMKLEQVPAEYLQSASPWGHTGAFGFGQKPNRAR